MNNFINSSTFNTRFSEILAHSKQILLTTHKMPDDDAISSLLTTYELCKDTYPQKQFTMAIEGSFHNRWENFQFYEQIIYTSNLSTQLANKDCLIFLDCNQYNRFTHEIESVTQFTGKKICIDHHKSIADQTDLIYLNPEAVANAYNVYDLFIKSVERPLTTSLATNLLLGIVGDTGNFKFIPPSQASVFSLVEKLITTANINLQTFLQYQTYNQPTINTYKQLIQNHQVITIAPWPSFACTFLSNEYLSQHQISDIEANEAIHLYANDFSRLQQDVFWSFAIYAKPTGEIKISARSLPGSINVRKLMETLKIGSGHDRAAGGKWPLESGASAENKRDEVIAWVGQNPPLFD